MIRICLLKVLMYSSCLLPFWGYKLFCGSSGVVLHSCPPQATLFYDLRPTVMERKGSIKGCLGGPLGRGLSVWAVQIQFGKKATIALHLVRLLPGLSVVPFFAGV